MTVHSSYDQTDSHLAAYGGVKLGERPHRGHDYVFVAERGPQRCALLVGREMRDDWDERSIEEDTPAAVRVLAHAEELFLPLASGTPAERLERFSQGFHQALTQSQEELQFGAKEHAGEAPSLTLTLAYIDRLRLHVGHVGDDRCYVLRNQQLHRMTTDHTVVPAEVEGPAVSDPMLSRKVLNVVGGFSDDLETETLAMELHADDVVLLCTPGVFSAVPEATLGEVLHRHTVNGSMSLEAVADAVFEMVPGQHTRTDQAIALARFRGPGKR